MYRMAWTSSVLLIGAAGAGAAVAAWSLGGALVFLLCAGSSAACVRHLSSEDGAPGRWRQAVWAGLVYGALVVAACGLVTWLGPQGLVVVALLALSSPPVVAAARRLDHHDPRSGPVEQAPAPDRGSDRPTSVRPAARAPVPEQVAATRWSFLDAPWMTRSPTSMDDPTLCLAWRVSFVALRQPVPPSSRLRLVERRRELLDELERRNPAGFQAWLASGARAAADPTKYIAPARHEVDGRDRR